ncbi:MAG: TatD family hydrolase [Paramuribaculum sp.]|nr:TatD family hydrolase [Paramuribaculum sp.]
MIRDTHTHNLLSTDGIISVDPSFSSFEAGKQYSTGIHPWLTGQEDIEETISMLDNIAMRNDVAAIGETGIDRLRGATEDIQTHIFVHHIKLAEHTGKPLIIHCVKALDIILRLHKKHRPSSPWIIHGFRGNPVVARQLTSRGIYLSLGEKFNPDAILNIPPHLLLAETDESHTSINSIAAAISPADPTLPFNNLKRLISTCKK